MYVRLRSKKIANCSTFQEIQEERRKQKMGVECRNIQKMRENKPNASNLEDLGLTNLDNLHTVFRFLLDSMQFYIYFSTLSLLYDTFCNQLPDGHILVYIVS